MVTMVAVVAVAGNPAVLTELAWQVEKGQLLARGARAIAEANAGSALSKAIRAKAKATCARVDAQTKLIEEARKAEAQKRRIDD